MPTNREGCVVADVVADVVVVVEVPADDVVVVGAVVVLLLDAVDVVVVAAAAVATFVEKAEGHNFFLISARITQAATFFKYFYAHCQASNVTTEQG